MEKIFLLCGLILSLYSPKSDASWTDPTGNQYHIQTDEGPERYFKYQTDNGQYRKEKRLEDGTVIGTDAWIDASGFLRQKEYIADNQGYRILKSKTVFVGSGRRIDDAMKYAKQSPVNDNNLIPSVQRFAPVAVTTPRPIVTTYRPVTAYSAPAAVKNVFIRPHSEPSQLYSSPGQNYIEPYDVKANYIPPNDINNGLFNSAEVKAPSRIYEPPETHYVDETQETLRKIQPIAVINTTPAPIGVTATPSSLYPTSTPAPVVYASPSTPRSTPSSYSSKPYYGSKDLHSYAPLHNNAIESRYDGVSLTNNDGFRYYLPRHYHEEEGSGAVRDGSFGYIDPFGIRRVIYYNVRPGRGFEHRKNNRYVGFNATPYDPRPSRK